MNRLSLLLLFGYAAKDRSQYERAMIGSREISTTERRETERAITGDGDAFVPSRTARRTIELILEQNATAAVGFRRANMAALLYRYFSDMSTSFRNIDHVLEDRADVLVVIGDNRTETPKQTVEIPTTKGARGDRPSGWLDAQAEDSDHRHKRELSPLS